MDIRAARVLVDSIADCYAALGVVHSLWQFIPGEFDDYIATPKDNLYRSIHTAVFGPGQEPVEIQIRTHEMHADSERGVAAHWRYKEGGRGDQAYERKINELRSLLAPAESAGGSRDFLDRVRVDLFQDRIYVISPKGEIVDVPVGGTPLDFAYQVHTDLGHRTRGAKVNGRMVPLDYRLKNSETVEIITAKTPQPSRDWLSAQSGFLASPRHRNKVRAWFRKQNEAQNKVEGRAMLERELQRLGVRVRRCRSCSANWRWTAPSRCMKRWAWERSARRKSPGRCSGCCTRARSRSDRSRAPSSARDARARGARASAICCQPMPAAASRCRRNPSWATSPSAAA